eukprot:46450_1
MRKWNHILYLFYWSLPNSFNMAKMKKQSNMRQDPSCLLSRVLYEISNTVSISVSSKELHDFGVTKRIDSNKNSGNSKRSIRRVKLIIEETKENHVLCTNEPTKEITVTTSNEFNNDSRDRFLFGGNRINGWCQMYHQEPRTEQEQKTIKSLSKQECIEKMIELNKSYIISWSKSFDQDRIGVNAIAPVNILAKAIAPEQYREIQCRRDQIVKDERNEMAEVSEQVQDRLKDTKQQILQQFFNRYIQKIHCEDINDEMKEMVNEMKKHDMSILANISESVQEIAAMNFKQVRLCDVQHDHWVYKCCREIRSGMETQLKAHKKQIDEIMDKYNSSIKGAKMAEDIEKARLEDKKRKKANNESRLLDTILHLSEVKTDEEIVNQTSNLNLAASKQMQQQVQKQRNKTLKKWIQLFEAALSKFTDQFYQARTKGTKLHPETVKNKLTEKIKSKYNLERQNLDVKLRNQIRQTQVGKTNMQITLNHLGWKSRHQDRWTSILILKYSIPKQLPPRYSLEFGKIDATADGDIKLNVMKNMRYEIPQTSEIVYHRMMNDGNVVMFIRGHDEDTKTDHTTIVTSTSRSLKKNQELKRLSDKSVQLVSYCQSQELFAILSNEKLGFAQFKGNRMIFSHKQCDLKDMYWWGNLFDKTFQAMLIQEIDRNIFVWLIDNEGVIRAYDYDADSWDSDKQFTLDQKYDNYVLSPMGGFLVAFKPQYEEQIYNDEVVAINENKHKNEENKIDCNDTDEKSCDEKDAITPKSDKKIQPTGRIELHAWLLVEKRKLQYKIHKDSKTGYEEGNEPKMDDDNKDELKVTDHVLLPKSFNTDMVPLNRLNIQQAKKQNCAMLTVITVGNKILCHPLEISLSDSRLKIDKRRSKVVTQREITKLDYLEYMIEKFGSRAAVYHPTDATLQLHTTYMMKEECKDALNLCQQVSTKIQKSLYDKERKNFKFFNWDCQVFEYHDQIKAKQIIKSIKNKNKKWKLDEFIRNLIVQIPIQIARGEKNQLLLMYNGEDDQTEYTKEQSIGSRSLCKVIRLSAYDGLIKSWEGQIKIVTSMGKQSTGKSYMLNHLFGTKFDVSGQRCTDGVWLTARIVDDVLYIICDFEGLGSFERSAQEDMLLATFNSAISNCTIFKCDNRFDRDLEDMFNDFQSGVEIMSGSDSLFAGTLLITI